jgi:Protein of unknown function (DUF3168)
MSDPSLELSAAMEAALRADAGVIAAFSGAQVRIYDIAPQNPPQGTGKPYIVFGMFTPDADLAQCIDAVKLIVTLDVWSLTDPPGTREAKRIAAATLSCITPVDAGGDHVPPSWTLPGYVIRAAYPLSTDHLSDPADQSAHSIVRVEYAIDPA